MDVSDHQLDFILLHIWQEIPHAPTPTVSSTDLPHNASWTQIFERKSSAFLAWSLKENYTLSSELPPRLVYSTS